MTRTIAILGGGKMGEALLAGLLAGGREAADIVVTERFPERASYLAETYGVALTDAVEAVGRAGIVVLATKPHDVAAVLGEVAAVVTVDHLVISVAAGVTCAAIERALPPGVPVIRCMPNTPALVGQGMTALAAGSVADDDHLAAAEQVLETVGRVVRVPEPQLDAVTALSGSGPAYFFLAVEALVDAGVLLGLPRALANELVVQTAVGAAAMLHEFGDSAASLREAVTSPAGTTAAALRQLEVHGVRAAYLAAAEAAAGRSRELGSGG